VSTGRSVLVVEDEPKLAALLCDYLRANGFVPQVAVDGPAALAAFAPTAGEVPAVVLLDLNLPGLDGLEVCRHIRRDSAVPILMLTARADEIDRIIGLEVGADDYLCKPYSPREVVARVRALLRRAEGRLAGQAGVPRAAGGGFALDDAGQRAWWQDRSLPLTPIEWRLLRTLLQQPGRVFERAQLLDAIHADFRDVSDRAVDSHVKNLRRKLQTAMAGPDCIATVYGVGYRLDLPAGAAEAPSDSRA
jgi:two-component system, OmpR family, response regulator BaeR